MQLPVHVIFSGRLEYHVHGGVLNRDLLSLDWNEVKGLDLAVEVGVNIDSGQAHMNLVRSLNLLENGHAKVNLLDVHRFQLQFVLP